MRKYIVGTYPDAGSRGVYSFALENGTMTRPYLFLRTEGPKYVASEKIGTVAVAGRGERYGVVLLNALGNVKDEILFEKCPACYVGIDNDHVYTANYHTGVCSDLKIIGGMLHLRHKIAIGAEAGCHQVLVHGDELYVPCLCQDRIAVFDKTTYVERGTIVFPEGTGPRHGVFSQDGNTLYIAGETSGILYTIDAVSHNIVHLDHITGTGMPAAVRMDDTESHLYVSVRGTGEIVIFDLVNGYPRKKAVVPSCGRRPQDILLCESGILCADRDAGKVYLLDESGKVLDEILVPGASSIAEIK